MKIKRTILPFLLISTCAASGCVLKSTHDEVMASGLQCDANLQARTKERDQLKAKLDESQTKLGDTESRNEELSQTNQMLAGKNSEFSKKSVEAQQELLRVKQEKEKTEEQLKASMQTYEDMVKALKQEVSDGQVLISQQGDRLTVNVADQVLFPSGSDTIQPAGKKVLAKVAQVLKKTEKKRIVVEGHTDNIPIKGTLKNRFGSNWELSASRASKVVRLLEENGVDGDKLSATGFADHKPIALNSSEDGRKKNRRTEIVLLPVVSLSATK